MAHRRYWKLGLLPDPGPDTLLHYRKGLHIHIRVASKLPR
jgi:hypothetical protein